MIDRDHKLPLARQAKVVGISRGSIYYRPRPVGEAGLRLMRRIDELHLEYPFAGSRMMRGLLRQEGLSSGRRHIATLMRRMGIEALYRKPTLTDTLPLGLNFVSANASPGGSCLESGGTVICSIGNPSNGDSVIATVVVSVPPSTVHGTTLTNTANATMNEIDTNAVNNTNITESRPRPIVRRT